MRRRERRRLRRGGSGSSRAGLVPVDGRGRRAALRAPALPNPPLKRRRSPKRSARAAISRMEANVAMPGLLADARLPLPATQLSSDDLSRAALGTLERLDCGWMAAEPGGRIFHMNTAARRMAVRGWLDPCNS